MEVGVAAGDQISSRCSYSCSCIPFRAFVRFSSYQHTCPSNQNGVLSPFVEMSLVFRLLESGRKGESVSSHIVLIVVQGPPRAKIVIDCGVVSGSGLLSRLLPLEVLYPALCLGFWNDENPDNLIHNLDIRTRQDLQERNVPSYFH
jgi:hypothetical protein